jgi:hypothetical protein
MALINNYLKPQPKATSTSSSTTTTGGGGTRGTLASEGLYRNPQASDEGLNQGTRSVANGLAYNRSVQDGGLVENRLVDLLGSDSAYIQQAEQAGKRYAASRGGINSMMAGNSAIAGARSAALPIAMADAASINAADSQNVDVLNQNHMQVRNLMNEATIAAANMQSARDAYTQGNRDAGDARQHDLLMQRERLGFEGEQRGLDRAHDYGMTGYDYGLRNQMADNDAYREEWLGNNQFNREFYGNMSTLAATARLSNARDFSNMLNQYALENPDIFSPENYMNAMDIMGGTSDYFLDAIWADLFGDF